MFFVFLSPLGPRQNRQPNYKDSVSWRALSVFLVGFCFLKGSDATSATVSYNNQSASVFQFSLINETSPLNTFLGNPNGSSGSPIPTASTDASGFDFLRFSPSANLSVAASGNPAVSYATSKFSFHISSPSNTYITDLKISLGGTYNINNTPLPSDKASIFLDTNVFIEAFGNLGTLPAGPTKTASYRFPAQEWTSATVGAVNWSVEWNGNLASIFSAPAMNVTKINFSITPDIFLLAENFGSGSLFLDQMTIAVIPEPSTASLLLVGLVPLLRARRNWKSC